MIRSALIVVCLLFAASAVQAQFRTIPSDAKRATMSHVEGMTIELDGRKMPLAAGAQIRDDRNMIVVPAMMPRGILVKYQVDAQGMIWRVWILSPQEAAQADKK